MRNWHFERQATNTLCGSDRLTAKIAWKLTDQPSSKAALQVDIKIRRDLRHLTGGTEFELFEHREAGVRRMGAKRGIAWL